MSNHTCKLKKDWEIKVHSCTRSCRSCMNCGECTEHNPQVDKNKSNTVIEHCSEPQCPECNLVAYNKGKLDVLQSLKEKIKILKEKTQAETGAYKYDFAYDECIDLLDKENI